MPKDACGLMFDMAEGPNGTYVVKDVLEDGTTNSRPLLEARQGEADVLEELLSPLPDLEPTALIPSSGLATARQVIADNTVTSLAVRDGLSFSKLIEIVALRTNVDVFVTLSARQGDNFIDVSYQVGRMHPDDIATFMTRRAMTRELREEVLDKALDDAAEVFYRGSMVRVDVGRAKTALGHSITTDAKGLAMDFNPTDEILELTARRELAEEYPGVFIPDDDVIRRMEQIQGNMNQHLFGADPRLSTATVPMTGSRAKDELITFRMLIENNGTFRGLSRNASDAEVNSAIRQLKSDGYVFHHSGKVNLNPDGYPIIEMQLIKTEAHWKLMRSYTEQTLQYSDFTQWVAALGEEARITTKVEQFLQHVGGCKVYSLFYGIRHYK